MLLPMPRIIERRARDYGSRNGHTPAFIVLHHTGGTNSLSWLAGNPNGTSIHYLIERDGTTYHMVPDAYAANHVGFSRYVLNGVVYDEHSPGPNCNVISLGIELENVGNGTQGYPPAQLLAAAWIIQQWWNIYGKIPVIRHADIDQHGKVDPINLAVDQVLMLIDPVPPATPVPVDPIDDTLTIIAPARARVDQASTWLIVQHQDPSYASYDVRAIAQAYWDTAIPAGVDPLLAFAQMAHETGHLTSWWCKRPRRNPCGLGVTGELRKARTTPGDDWAYDDRGRLWKRGYSFASWKDAIKAHLGHLLVYSVPQDQWTSAQSALVVSDPRAGFVLGANRGTAQRLHDLDGRWAVPGIGYGSHIAAIAEAITRMA